MATVSGFDPATTITPDDPRLSRMENLLMPSNWFDTVYRQTKSNEITIQRVIQDVVTKRLGYHGAIKKDPQYEGRLEFSTDDGRTFSSPAVGILGNAIVQIRLSLSQYQTDSPIHAYKLEWYLPNGWVWTDGLGTTTYDEAVSNPMVVTRVSRSPTNPQPVGFRVLIAERYW